MFDLDLESQSSQGQGRPSCQKSWSNGSNRRAPTDKRTDTHTDATKRIISPAVRSITMGQMDRHQFTCLLAGHNKWTGLAKGN